MTAAAAHDSDLQFRSTVAAVNALKSEGALMSDPNAVASVALCTYALAQGTVPRPANLAHLAEVATDVYLAGQLLGRRCTPAPESIDALAAILVELFVLARKAARP